RCLAPGGAHEGTPVVAVGTDDRDLDGPAGADLGDGVGESPAGGARRAGDEGAEGAGDGVGPVAPVVVAGEPVGPAVGVQRGAGAVRGGVLGDVARAADQLLAVVGGVVQTAVVGDEGGVEGAQQREGVGQEAGVAVDGREGEECVRDGAVVVGGAGRGGEAAGERDARDAAVAHVQGAQQVRGAAGGLEPGGAVEQHGGLDQGDDSPAVPGRDDLVVAGGAGALGTGGEEAFADTSEPGGVVGFGEQAEGGGAALEGAGLGDAEQGGGAVAVVVAQDVAQLGGGPDVEGALLRVAGGVGAVGVEGGGEAALGGGHLALQPADGVGDDALAEGGEVVVAAAGGLDGAAGVAAEQERVVVEHLLEVGHDPAGVDGVAGEAAAELVVDAAAGHGAEDVAGDAPGLVGDGPVGLGGAAQQGVDHGG